MLIHENFLRSPVSAIHAHDPFFSFGGHFLTFGAPFFSFFRRDFFSLWRSFVDRCYIYCGLKVRTRVVEQDGCTVYDECERIQCLHIDIYIDDSQRLMLICIGFVI